MNDGTTRPKPSILVRRRLWIIALALGLAAVIGYGLAATSSDEGGRGGAPAGSPPAGGAPGARVVPVSAVPARAGEVRVYLDGIGTVTPLANVTVRTRVDGELFSVHFREGDLVKAGDLLAEIDPRPFQVQLEQAEGQMARDQALLANARVDLKRYKTLVAQNSIPKQQLDTQESLVLQYEAALASDQAQIDQAKLQLTYARITAPVSGRLGLRLVDQGNIVHASDAGGLVVLTQIEPIAVVFPIPEDDLPLILPKLRAGDPLTVEAWDRDSQNQLASGRVLTVDNSIDPTTGTVRVKAEFANKDEALFPNQFVNARLVLEVRKDATLVPSAAIQHGTDGTFVYLVGPNNTVELRPVKVGPVEKDDTSIESGLAAGDVVVVDGTLGLRAGTVVSLGTPGADAGARKSS
jgi:multidrug efflux system membrane fusion protein